MQQVCSVSTYISFKDVN